MVRDKIKKVKSIDLCNFRGFCGEKCKCLNTDADIVIITGPNGFGKTSLMDALCIALTGHFYPERVPLVSNGFDKAVIKMEAELGEDRSKQFRIDIDTNNQIKGGTDLPLVYTDGDRQLAARASFFYQDIIEYLFEEESAEVTLANFLVTVPVSISSITNTISKARYTVESSAKNLSPESEIPTEQQTNERRIKAANQLQDAWQRTLESPYKKQCFDTIPEFPRNLVVGEGTRLGARWVVLLSSWAAGCSSKVGKSSVGSSDPKGALDQLQEYAEHVSRQVTERIAKEQVEQKNIAGLLAVSKESMIILTERKFQEAKDEISKLEEHIPKLREKLQELRSLGQHFRYESGIGLSEIIGTLRSAGKQWKAIPQAVDDYAIPHDVVQWLDEAVRRLDAYDPPVDQQFDVWNKGLVESIRDREKEINDANKQMALLQESVQATEKVWKLVNDIPGLESQIEKLKQEGKETVLGSELLSMLQLEAKNPVVHENPMDNVIRALKNWQKIESDEIEHEKQRRKSESYRTALSQMNALADALKKESAKGTSTISNLELVSANSQERFAEDMSYILDRFFSVPGISPIKLAPERKREKKREKELWRIQSDDKRILSSFSSGQRAQLAISVLLALNASIRDMLWFEVIAFDDFTATLDMTQLPRLATLIRQIAYGPTDGKHLRRQVFIASHHEDVTDELIGYLIPPKGRTMRVLDFKDWHPKKGPVIEQLEVRCGSSTHEVNERFADLLDETLFAGTDF
ncbi:MAG: AAA family ATPase [Limnochordia bacterium]|nr:AAA family ATPase [Limnochordia bacterium]